MSGKRVAVEESLTPFKEYLQQQGYDVVDMKANALQHVQAVVLSGMDDNLMGVQDRLTNGIVVNAEGRTPEDVYRELKQRLR